jgi:hypothetical protein
VASTAARVWAACGCGASLVCYRPSTSRSRAGTFCGPRSTRRCEDWCKPRPKQPYFDSRPGSGRPPAPAETRLRVWKRDLRLSTVRFLITWASHEPREADFCRGRHCGLKMARILSVKTCNPPSARPNRRNSERFSRQATAGVVAARDEYGSHGPGWGFAFKIRGRQVPQPLLTSLFPRNSWLLPGDKPIAQMELHRLPRKKYRTPSRSPLLELRVGLLQGKHPGTKQIDLKSQSRVGNILVHSLRHTQGPTVALGRNLQLVHRFSEFP